MSMIHSRQHTYAGIDAEDHHGMTMSGRIIRDAWVFGLLPELAQRHARIHAQAVARARAMGWDAELGDDD